MLLLLLILIAIDSGHCYTCRIKGSQSGSTKQRSFGQTDKHILWAVEQTHAVTQCAAHAVTQRAEYAVTQCVAHAVTQCAALALFPISPFLLSAFPSFLLRSSLLISHARQSFFCTAAPYCKNAPSLAPSLGFCSAQLPKSLSISILHSHQYSLNGAVDDRYRHTCWIARLLVYLHH